MKFLAVSPGLLACVAVGIMQYWTEILMKFSSSSTIACYSMYEF